MPREIIVKVYKFKELSDDAKEKARYWFRGVTDNSDVWEYIKDDAKNVGLTIASLDAHRANGGKFDVGPVDCARAIISEHGASCETHKTATAFLKKWEGLVEAQAYASDDNDNASYAIEDAYGEFLDSILEDYRIMLDKESEYQNSDEVVDETIVANEYEFTADGKRARC